MRSESKQLEKTMQNRHLSVGTFVDEMNATKPTSSDSEENPNTSMEGYLFKRTSKGFKSWNRRWFYLCDNQLLYRYT